MQRQTNGTSFHFTAQAAPCCCCLTPSVKRSSLAGVLGHQGAGEKGAQGDTGPAGAPGAPGKDGLAGIPGRDGSDGTWIDTALVNSSGCGRASLAPGRLSSTSF